MKSVLDNNVLVRSFLMLINKTINNTTFAPKFPYTDTFQYDKKPIPKVCSLFMWFGTRVRCLPRVIHQEVVRCRYAAPSTENSKTNLCQI